MNTKTIFLLSFLSGIGNGIRCFQCSQFPREEFSEDEYLGPCPAAVKSVVKYPANSLYDGCLLLELDNGTVAAQNAVIYEDCVKNYRYWLEDEAKTVFGQKAKVTCCGGDLCNRPRSQTRPKQRPKRILIHQSETLSHRTLPKKAAATCECCDDENVGLVGSLTTRSGGVSAAYLHSLPFCCALVIVILRS